MQRTQKSGKLKGWIVLCMLINGFSFESEALAKSKATTKNPEPAASVDFSAPYLRTLKKARHFCGRYVGYTTEQTNAFKAYEQALAQGPKIRAQLEEIVKDGSPAGKLYSAILIQKFDSTAGLAALKNLESDQDVVAYNFEGCVFWSKPVSEVASLLIKFPTIRAKCFEEIEAPLTSGQTADQ